jgi:hypothetical protein
VNEFAWNLRVHAGVDGRATAYVRAHQFEVGAPLHFDPDYAHVTALEYALGALGAELANGMMARCRRRRIHVEQVEVLVGAELRNALTYLDVIGETGDPGLKRVTVRVYASSEAAQDQLEQVWSELLARSPLACTLAAAVQLDLVLQVVP